MRWSWGLFFIVVSLTTLADTQFITQIHDIDYGTQLGEEPLLLLTTGHVAKLGHLGFKSVNGLNQAKERKTWLKIRLNDKRQVLALQATEPPKTEFQTLRQRPRLMEYLPSTAESISEARRMFRRSPYNSKESQCYNRAHVWTFEWYKANDFQANKVWVFFTRKYIRKFDFEWWFHVSPYIHVQEDSAVLEKVMDIKYGRGPLALRDWTNIFIRNDAECNVVHAYSEWANFPETGWCYLMKTPMYYYQPVDIEMLETWGTDKTDWVETEVKGAYSEAFDLYYE